MEDHQEGVSKTGAAMHHQGRVAEKITGLSGAHRDEFKEEES